MKEKINVSLKLIKKDPIKAIELKDNLIEDLYKTRCLTTTASNFGYIGTCQIKKFLKAFNINCNQLLIDINNKYLEDNKNKIIEKYLNGVGIVPLTKEFNISFAKIKQLLIDNNIQLKDKSDYVRERTSKIAKSIYKLSGDILTDAEIKNIVEQLKLGETKQLILKQYNISMVQLNKICKRHNIKKERGHNFKQFIKTNSNIVLDFYKTHTMLETANYFKLNRGSLRTWLLENSFIHDKKFIYQRQAENLKKTCQEKYGTDSLWQVKEFREKTKQTNLERYGIENVLQVKEIKEKAKQTNLEKYGYENPFQAEEIKEKIKQTNLEKYGYEYASQSPEIKEKTKNTNLQRYGVDNYTKTDEYKSFYNNHKTEIVNKINITKVKNKSFNKSKVEDDFYMALLKIFDRADIYRQYNTKRYENSNRYPFNCDFYIKSLDLFIEINNHWTHGGHLFNDKNQEDINKVNKWTKLAETSKFYKLAKYVWTKSDIKKNHIAKQNNLNYISLYSLNDINNFLNNLEVI